MGAQIDADLEKLFFLISSSMENYNIFVKVSHYLFEPTTFNLHKTRYSPTIDTFKAINAYVSPDGSFYIDHGMIFQLNSNVFNNIHAYYNKFPTTSTCISNEYTQAT